VYAGLQSCTTEINDVVGRFATVFVSTAAAGLV
jgi:hypothetical protein